MVTFDEVLRWVSKDDSIAIPSDANLKSLINVDKYRWGEWIQNVWADKTLSCLFVDVVFVQSCTHVSICARNRGVVGSVLSNFWKGGAEVWISTTSILFEVGEETNENFCSAIIVVFCCRDFCIRAISAKVGSTVWFYGEPCVGGVLGDEYVDIDKACEWIVWVLVLLIWTEILFDISRWGWRRFHAASEENGVYKRTLYPASRQSCVNIGRMDLVVIQYRTVRVGSPDNDACRMSVSDSNACSGMSSLGIMGWVRITIVTADVVGNSNRGNDAVALEIHPLLPQSIRAITYRCW